MEPTIQNKVISVLLFLVVALGIAVFVLNNRIKSTHVDERIQKLERQNDSLRLKYLISENNIFHERKKLREASKRDSAALLVLKHMYVEDHKLLIQEQKIRGSYAQLSTHRLLDSLHKKYEKDHFIPDSTRTK